MRGRGVGDHAGAKAIPDPKPAALRHGGVPREQVGQQVGEVRARGADLADHRWCIRHRLGPGRHCCYPVDWAAEQRRRPTTSRQAGHDRNTRMLLREWPELVVAFHHQFDVRAGGTSNMCLKVQGPGSSEQCRPCLNTAGTIGGPA